MTAVAEAIANVSFRSGEVAVAVAIGDTICRLSAKR